MGSSATVLNVASIVADETTMYGGVIGKPAFSSFTLALTERKLSTTGRQSVSSAPPDGMHAQFVPVSCRNTSRFACAAVTVHSRGNRLAYTRYASGSST